MQDLIDQFYHRINLKTDFPKTYPKNYCFSSERARVKFLANNLLM
jgi:hypothetical protein